MKEIDQLRQHLASLLGWGDAHANLESAVADLRPELRGVTPPGLPYSPWQLLEHIRLAQADILSFCTRSDYQQGAWPDDYWPKDASPPNPDAWDASLAAYRKDRAQLEAMVRDESRDLFAKVPAGEGQTFLREILLIADHTAYHVGQLVTVRRLVGDWEGD